MPWEITIVNAATVPTPLGQRDEVIAKFAAAFPGLLLQPPPGPSAEFLEMMPAIIRQNMLRPRLAANFEGEGFIIQFYAGDTPLLESVGAEVRGDGNPIPALAALCVPNGWGVVNVSDGSIVELSQIAAPEWERFRKWRDTAVRSLKSAGRPSAQ